MSEPSIPALLDKRLSSTPVVSAHCWPTAFLDEVMPPGHVTPDGWLCRLDDGSWAIGLKVPPAGSEAFAAIPIAIGDTIAFNFCSSFGKFTMTIGEDGAWALDRPASREATYWWSYDVEDVWDTAGELAKSLFDRDGANAYPVEAYAWSDDIAYRLEAAGDSAHFVAVEVAA